MCGISGLIDSRASTGRDELETRARAMAHTLTHRGPDDEGVWADETAGVGLGHRRLSIIDLSPAGHQPMVSADGRYVLVYNGEIYNFSALRKELEAAGTRFRGNSDTEVLLEAIARWGLEEALLRSNGMFAFAVWDREQRMLHLARDRFGEKPLYFGWAGDTFLFASELKALRAFPAFEPEIDRRALALYLQHNYVPAPHSIYVGINKLLPGTMVSIDPSAPGQVPLSRRYWFPAAVAADGGGSSRPAGLTDADAGYALEELMLDSIRMRMVSDVPLGAFLSGGIDSSLIVSLMQAQSMAPVRTFTIGFREVEFDEAHYAASVARHLGTEHVGLTVTPAETMAMVPRLATIYDEPFADSSQIPTAILSELTRRYVTVSLSGDGGDELFGGYTRYSRLDRFVRSMRVVPPTVRRAAARTLNSLSTQGLERMSRVLPGPMGRNPAHTVRRLAVMVSSEPSEAYESMMSYWERPESIVLGHTPSDNHEDEIDSCERLTRPVEQAMCLDAQTYLPDDILTKVDRATMAVSLEARVPFLDHRLYEFAWGLPMSLKISRGTGKRLPRRVLHRYVPPRMVERPKMGFGVPVGSWLRGPLRPWAEELLSRERLDREGFLDPAPIRQRWSEHVDGLVSWEYQLWGVLMFEAWLEEQTAPNARG